MLNKPSLKGRIITELEALGFEQGDYSWIDKFAQALANAVIDEITTNGQTTTVAAGTHNHGIV